MLLVLLIILISLSGKVQIPPKDNWEIAVKEFKVGAWDPAFHYDEDTDKLYLYWGSSNAYPILGTEINTKTLQSEGYVKNLFRIRTFRTRLGKIWGI